MKRKILLLLLPFLLASCGDDGKPTNNQVEPEQQTENENPDPIVDNGLDFNKFISSFNNNFTAIKTKDMEEEIETYCSYIATRVHEYKLVEKDGLRTFSDKEYYLYNYTIDFGKIKNDFADQTLSIDENLETLFYMKNERGYRLFDSTILEYNFDELTLEKVSEGIYSTSIAERSEFPYEEEIFCEKEDKCLIDRYFTGRYVEPIFESFETRKYTKFGNFDDEVLDSLYLSKKLDINDMIKHAYFNEGKNCFSVSAFFDNVTRKYIYNAEYYGYFLDMYFKDGVFEKAILTDKYRIDDDRPDIYEISFCNIGSTTIELPEPINYCDHTTETYHKVIDGKCYYYETCSCGQNLHYEIVDGSTGYCPICNEPITVYAEDYCVYDYSVGIFYNYATKVITDVYFVDCYGHKWTEHDYYRYTKYCRLGPDKEYEIMNQYDFYDDYYRKRFYILIIGDMVYFCNKLEETAHSYDEAYFEASEFYRDPIHLNVDLYLE